MVKTIDVLGTKYKVHIGVPFGVDSRLGSDFGYCSPTDRKIVVGDLATADSWKDDPAESRERHHRITLRHEIIHAFIAESGLSWCSMSSDSWAMNEEMVDWIAMQWPKIQKVYEKLGCEG